LNPGFSPVDLFAEEHESFRRARWENLRGESDFLGLDPRFAWTSGFDYWHGKLATVIRGIAKRKSVTHQEALRYVAASICVVELVPYCSPSFGLSDRVVREMKSPQLAKAFVHEALLPRARSGDALIVVTRQAQRWGLDSESGAVIYEGRQTRAAHLSETSPGGRRILDFLAPVVPDANWSLGGN
ncbi:MAG: hypothetical protein ACRELE_04115, partial [Gemmatimonadales bacterium]